VLSHRLGKKQESEAAYRKSLDIRPDDGDCLKNLGLLLIEKGEAAEAAVLLEKMTTSHPGSIDGRLALAVAYVKLDKTQEAVNVWRDVVRMDGSQTEARLNLADGLWNMGLVRDARFHYTTVLKNQPSNARALNGMGLWHLSQGDSKQAESFFRRSMNSDGNYLPAYNNLAISLERLNQKAQAILILRKALQKDPNFDDARTNLERLEKPANMAL
jgi:Tfp pilus assembly protein PilF